MNVNWEAVQAVATVTLVVTSLGAIGYAGLQLKHEREYRVGRQSGKAARLFPRPHLRRGASAPGRRTASKTISAAEGEPEHASLAPWEIDDPPVSAFEVLDFYEHLALLVKKGHLDLYDVWHTFYEWAQPVYVDLQPLIEGPESPYRDHYVDLQRMMRQHGRHTAEEDARRGRRTTGPSGPATASSSTTGMNSRSATAAAPVTPAVGAPQPVERTAA